MDLEDLRSAINSALQSISAETLAAQAGGITAKSVLNFASGSVKRPQPSQRGALEQWVARRRPTNVMREQGPTYNAGQATDRYDAGVLAGQAQTIRRLLAMALDETDKLVAGFDRWAAIAPREVLDEVLRRDQAADAVDGPEGRTGTG